MIWHTLHAGGECVHNQACHRNQCTLTLEPLQNSENCERAGAFFCTVCLPWYNIVSSILQQQQPSVEDGSLFYKGKHTCFIEEPKERKNLMVKHITRDSCRIDTLEVKNRKTMHHSLKVETKGSYQWAKPTTRSFLKDQFHYDSISRMALAHEVRKTKKHIKNRL